VLERYPVTLALVVFVVSAASLFAFLVMVGAYLRVVGSGRARPPMWLGASVAACLAAPLSVAFRDMLLRAVGADPSHEGINTLAALVFGSGFLAGVLTLAAQSALRHARRG